MLSYFYHNPTSSQEQTTARADEIPLDVIDMLAVTVQLGISARA